MILVNWKNYIDHSLDVLGYIPVVSTYSGSVRIAVGFIQAITSVALMAIMMIAEQWSTLTVFDEECHTLNAFHGSDALDQRITAIAHLFGYSCLQIIRGLVETMGLIGNLLALASDFGVDALRGRTIYALVWTDPEGKLDRPVFNIDLVRSGLSKLNNGAQWLDAHLTEWMQTMKEPLYVSGGSFSSETMISVEDYQQAHLIKACPSGSYFNEITPGMASLSEPGSAMSSSKSIVSNPSLAHVSLVKTSSSDSKSKWLKV